MSDGEYRRLERDVESLAGRINIIENASSPYAQALLNEFRELQQRVNDFSQSGTPHSRRELRYMSDRMTEMKVTLEKKADARDLEELQNDMKDNRRMVRSALIAASLSLAAGIILFVLQRVIK